MSTHVVILGAGFGGLELSSRLDEELGDRVRVTLIDQSDSFVFGFSKLDVMYGRQPLDQVQIQYGHIAKPSVDFRQETVVSIDPTLRRVVTDRADYDADILVVALGADLDPAATPGLLEGGYEFYSPGGADRVSAVLPTFESGVAVISVLGAVLQVSSGPLRGGISPARLPRAPGGPGRHLDLPVELVGLIPSPSRRRRRQPSSPCSPRRASSSGPPRWWSDSIPGRGWPT